MDSRQLRYFAAICRFRNLSHAADHCHTAASALSHHLAKLESELGVALFTRKPRGMEPTAAGLRLLSHAQAILAAFETASSDLRHGQAELSGDIVVGMPFSVINMIGGALMRTVVEDFPQVRLIIREGLSAVNDKAVRTGEVSMALIFNPPADRETVRIPLLKEELFCVGHRDIVGDEPKPMRLEEMAKLPVALLQSGVFLRALSDRPAELAKLEAQARIELASIAVTLCAIKEGIACTLAPRALVRDELSNGELVARSLNAPRPMRTLYLVKSADSRPTFLSEKISSLISGLVHDALHRGLWEGALPVRDRQ